MIAYHFARTEEHAEAAEWLERAGDRAAATYANETAIENYQEARRRLENLDTEPAVLARLDEKLGEVLNRIARFDDAVSLLERAVERYREARDLEGAGRAAALLGRAVGYRGEYQDALTRVQPMIELLSWSGPSQALASLYLVLASLFQAMGRYEDMQEAAEKAVEIAGVLGDERLDGWALERRASALNFLGRGDEAAPVLRDAIQILERVGALDRLGLALTNLGEAQRLRGELEEARRSTERALEVSHRVGDPVNVAFDLMNLGQIEVSLGRWAESQEHLERSGELMAALPSTSDVANYVPASQGWLLLAQGDWAEAEDTLRRALGMAEATGDRQALEYIHVPLAELDVLRGKPQSAIDELEPLAGREGGFRVIIEATLAWAYLEQGKVHRATELAEAAVEHARTQGERLSLADALRIQGMVLAREEQWEEADRAFEEAASLAHSMPFPYAEARALAARGMMALSRREDGQGRQHLEEALTIFRALGAKKDVEATEHALAAADISASPR
jgi:tetratricopeptide (TPR) repeat protein